MPSSNATQIPHIARIIRTIKPSKVLDIGTGYGKYGFLVREYVDNFNMEVQLDGIEPAPKNLRVLKELYDHLYLQSFLSLWEDNLEYDIFYSLGMMIDVIEHFHKEDGFDALHKALRHCKAVLIATPKNPAPQEGEYEAHLSKWTKQDMASVGNWQDFSTDSTLIGVLTKK